MSSASSANHNIYCGCEVGSLRESDGINGVLQTARDLRFDYVVIPIDERPMPDATADSQHSKVAASPAAPQTTGEAMPSYDLEPSAGSDLVLASSIWSSSVVGVVSPWVTVDLALGCKTGIHSEGGATEEGIGQKAIHLKHVSTQALLRQLKWATHCGYYATILPTPHVPTENLAMADCSCPNYARLLSQFLTGHVATQLWVRIPLVVRRQLSDENDAGSEINQDDSAKRQGGENVITADGWQVWNSLRLQMDSQNNLGVALELTTEFPIDGSVVDRWLSEPVRVVVIPMGVFMPNSSNLPALPKAHKQFIMKVMRMANPQIIIKTPQGGVEPQILDKYLNYIRRLYHSFPPLSEAEEFEAPYWDLLQSPLQPLRDNLESQTYETFERDPVKYRQYEEAIWRCLRDRAEAGKKSHVIVVVGAGRGPLVAAALRALRRMALSMEQCKVAAVEKNENAIITLRARVKSDPDLYWRDVEVVAADMRQWEPEDKVDIMVSELLGSFGDNELSPECLDGAQRLLNPDGGVSIPCRYWSSIEPISSVKLWSECRNQIGSCDSSTGNRSRAAYETGYVVKIKAAYSLSVEGPTKCFEFVHPTTDTIKEDNSHNTRYAEIPFTVKNDCLLHGFAGYFHCDLYKDVTISIHPPTVSVGMFSWFPLFLPIREPLFLEKGKVLNFSIWRLSDARQVWYEWATTTPRMTSIHNIGGRSHSILR